MENFSRMIGDIFRNYVKPVVRFKVIREGFYTPIAATGTGFNFGDGTFVTCWHCVGANLPEDEVYGVPIEHNGVPAAGVAVLTEIAQDENGTDLAVAQVGLEYKHGFRLSSEPAGWGEEVVAFSYPLTLNTRNPTTGHPLIKTQARVFRGYVMSILEDDLHFRRPSTVYELDMPAPKWASGSPLFRINPFELVGVVQGQRQSVDCEGDFGFEYSLAHHLDVLRNVRCATTGNVSLSDFLKTHLAPRP